MIQKSEHITHPEYDGNDSRLQQQNHGQVAPDLLMHASKPHSVAPNAMFLVTVSSIHVSHTGNKADSHLQKDNDTVC